VDAFGTEAHRRLDGALHGAAERDAALERWAIDWAQTMSRRSRASHFDVLRCVSDFVISISFLRSFSMSAPFLPMIRPGRAAWMVTRHFL
jgi:hypothetical protein